MLISKPNCLWEGVNNCLYAGISNCTHSGGLYVCRPQGTCNMEWCSMRVRLYGVRLAMNEVSLFTSHVWKTKTKRKLPTHVNVRRKCGVRRAEPLRFFPERFCEWLSYLFLWRGVKSTEEIMIEICIITDLWCFFPRFRLSWTFSFAPPLPAGICCWRRRYNFVCLALFTSHLLAVVSIVLSSSV